MNYLAHAFLSNNDKDLLIGNFIADHVRGSDLSRFPESIAKGIYLHRRIDSFTDDHPAFKSCKRLFYDGFNRHSGILVDIYYDHLLARNFGSYSNEALDVFSKKVYGIYSENEVHFPQSSSGFLAYAIKNNIYTAYGSTEGIERVLTHLSQRIRHGVDLEKSLELFMKNEKEIFHLFESFFREALAEFGSDRVINL
jgi:acyl carrier protein phosphodiesterase